MSPSRAPVFSCAHWLQAPATQASSDEVHGRYVTCCKTSLPWAGKTRNMYRFSQSLLSITNFRTTACNSLICCQTGLKVASWTRIRSTATLQNKLHASCTFLLLVLQYLSVSRLCHRYALTEKAWEDAIQRLGNSRLLERQLGPIVTGTFREKVAMLITGKRGMDHVKTPNFVSSCSVRHVNHLLAFLIRCSFWSSYISSLLLNFYEVLNIVSV